MKDVNHDYRIHSHSRRQEYTGRIQINLVPSTSLSRLGRIFFGAAEALRRPPQLGSPAGFARREFDGVPTSIIGVTLLPDGLLSCTGGNYQSPEANLPQQR
ncbi:hypothetical protein Bbelb_163800 [Branchiostoma belcheri]|nr:hypothetical protein Bbelb_163800 [Branchiostoma belcheri]